MPPFQRLTEADLRTAMTDRRYWQSGHPERMAYTGWVRQGWQSLHPAGGPSRSAVWVRPYMREGHQVAGHWRGAPPGGGGEGGVITANALRDPKTGQPLLPGQRLTPLEGGGGGGGAMRGGSRPQQQPQSAAWRPPAGEQSPAMLNSPSGPRTIEFPPGQLNSKYKHAVDFGLPPNWNRANGIQYEQSLRAHIENPATLRIVGTYRGSHLFIM